ncbi:hypothetical protein [Helicobacter ailurogastricus]|uniref:Poly E-rich protein n=1 Tax=Helicobacter ailurogastricus TaxID=1578720 RepID=A0A0K2XXW4_9HELI|nr:hypothetical protein [Helicobacter ailurogastricus]BDQ29094.1 hypothetical protein ASB7_09310 [Helicobacter ailurogastricus]CRF51981.1 hypothetical protein HAL07_01070 [Helicobacter ailurogastricus]
MQILLVNQNKIVGKLFENIAKKLDLDLVAAEHVEEILPTLEENPNCFFFADDTAVDSEEYARLKPHLETVKFSGLLLRKGIEEFGEFTHYIKKPFLPTDVLHILQRSMEPMEPKGAKVEPFALEQAPHTETDIFKDIDSSLSQLENLLDVDTPKSTPPQDESQEGLEIKKEENPAGLAKELESQGLESGNEPTGSEEETKTDSTESKTEMEQAPQEGTQEESQTPLPLNLDDLLPIDEHERETHAGLEHEEMLEDLVQESSPKAQDLMDSMQNMEDFMHSIEHDPMQSAQESTEATQESNPTEPEELVAEVKPPQSEEQVLEAETKQESQAKPQVQEAESTSSLETQAHEAEPKPEPEAQIAETEQEAPTKQELEDTAEFNPQEEIKGAEAELEGLDLTDTPSPEEPEATAQTQPEPEIAEPETLEPTPESAKPTNPEGITEPEPKDEGTEEVTELEPEPKLEETQDAKEQALETATEAAQEEPKAPESETAPEQDLVETAPTAEGTQENLMDLEKDPQEYEHIEDIPQPVMSSIVDGSYEAERAPQVAKPAQPEPTPTPCQEQMPAEEPKIAIAPVQLDLDLQDLLKDLPIDPKLLEGKTLQVQVHLVDKK